MNILPERTSHPRGWHLAAYGDELVARAVKALKNFGREAVLFRDESKRTPR